MNNKYRLNIISIIIALLISSVITVFVYSIGNKDNIRLQSFNQKIHLNHTHFVQTMKERFEYFLTTYQNEIQQLNLKINHELKFQPNTKFTAGDFNIGVDEIIISAGFGQSQNEMIESMHRISEEVIPYFKKSSSQVA